MKVRTEPAVIAWLKAGLVCGIAVGVLFVAAGPQGQGGIVSEATAVTTDAYVDGYFPAQFPAPQGPVEPHIQAF